MKQILKVVVGSRLHNLHNEKSDYDYRGIFVHDLIDIVSPFRKVKNTSWIEGDVDNTSYELRDFCMYATKGNPTILEVLFSNMVEEEDELGKELRENRHKFLDSTRIFEAYKGYAHNQYNKMNLFEPDQRTPKFAVAYLRSLYQGAGLLERGEIENQISGGLRDWLMEVKYNFSANLIQGLSKDFAQLQTKLSETYYKNHDKFKPDVEWIEQFLMKAYAEPR